MSAVYLKGVCVRACFLFFCIFFQEVKGEMETVCADG